MSSLLTGPNDDSGILSRLGVVGLKWIWDQKLFSGMLLTFMHSKTLASVRICTPESNMTANRSNTTVYVGVTIFALCFLSAC